MWGSYGILIYPAGALRAAHGQRGHELEQVLTIECTDVKEFVFGILKKEEKSRYSDILHQLSVTIYAVEYNCGRQSKQAILGRIRDSHLRVHQEIKTGK